MDLKKVHMSQKNVPHVHFKCTNCIEKVEMCCKKYDKKQKGNERTQRKSGETPKGRKLANKKKENQRKPMKKYRKAEKLKKDEEAQINEKTAMTNRYKQHIETKETKIRQFSYIFRSI